MNPQVAAFCATSVDGYLARADGGLDWLDVPGAPDGEDYGYGAFVAQVDALVMGRRTYETVRGFDAWPYGDLPVRVLSSKPLPVPAALADRVSTVSDAPARIVARLAAEGRPRIYVDGGETIRRFLAAGCIDTLILTRIPILLGDGIPLFAPGGPETRLIHQETRTFPNGLVQSRYAVAREGR